METQCFSLQLEFISPGIFLGTAFGMVMLICEKNHSIKNYTEDSNGVVSDGGEL